MADFERLPQTRKQLAYIDEEAKYGKQFIKAPAVPPPEFTKFGNPDARMASTNMINHIAMVCGKVLKRKLDTNEIRSIRSYILSIPRGRMNELSDAELVRLISNKWLEEYQKETDEERHYDLHTLQVNQMKSLGEDGEGDAGFGSQVSAATAANQIDIAASIDVAKILGQKSLYDVTSAINPDALEMKAYLYLDSRYRSLNTDGTTSLRWGFVNSVNVSQGSVNSIAKIANITKLKILPFKIPYATSAETDYSVITLGFSEFGSEAFIGQENRNFQFVFDYSLQGTWISLVPLNEGIYEFTKPINQLDTLTATFGSPLEPVTFDIDRLKAYPQTSGVPGPVQFNFTQVHNLSTGQRVYFSAFTTASPAADLTLINVMNSTAGVVIVVTSTTSFTVASVDYGNLTGAVNTAAIDCYFASKRMFIPLEVTYTAPKTSA